MQKLFAKLTWRLAPGWQLVQSFHDEIGIDPERPTIVTPFEATARTHISTPTMNFGNLTHTMSANTLWDVRVGRFVSHRSGDLNALSPTTPSRFDRVTGVTTGARQSGAAVDSSGRPPRRRSPTTCRALDAEHQWKIGGQFERGEHHAINFIPTDVRYEDRAGQPFQSISSLPANIGGVSLTSSAFATDAMTVGDRLTITAGVRFDHSRAISQDLPAVDAQAARDRRRHRRPRNDVHLEPVVAAAGCHDEAERRRPHDAAGELRTVQPGRPDRRAGAVSPWCDPVTMVGFNSATGDYTGPSITVDPKVNLQWDPEMRAPRTDEYSIGVDREVGRRLAVSMAYVRKDGSDFIGWTDVAGKYVEGTQTLADGRSVTVYRLDTTVTPPAARRFLLTNPDGYSLTYNGLVMAAEKRRANGWQAFGSYTLSKAYGLQASSNATAAGAQTSTVSPPQPSTFGRDPNDLTNARGRLPNDRPHIFRLMGSVDVPRTGLVVAANLQYFSGKPWAATAQVTLPQGPQRILLEPRGSRRLSSQTLLDVRVSRTITLGGSDDRAAPGRAQRAQRHGGGGPGDRDTDDGDVFSPTFGQPVSFMDPRRAMIGVRLNLGR